MRYRSPAFLAPKEPMHPTFDHESSAAIHDELPDGRDSLRVVKIRLALTLIAVAILPFAAVAPIAEINELLERPSNVVAAVGIADPTGAFRLRTGSESAAFAELPPPAEDSSFGLVPTAKNDPITLQVTTAIAAL